jgi:hypothetical protein
MNEAKARDVRVWLLQAMLMISNNPRPDSSEIQAALDRTKRAVRLLEEMRNEAIVERG